MIARRTFLYFCFIGLTGCGFKLRGTGDSMGTLPAALRIETVDPFSLMIKTVKQQLISEGCDVVETENVPVLTVSEIQSSTRVLGPVTTGDQTELIYEISYHLVGSNLITIIPKTSIRTSLVYVNTGSENTADDSRLMQLKSELEQDLTQQIVPSLRIQYHQALKQDKTDQ